MIVQERYVGLPRSHEVSAWVKYIFEKTLDAEAPRVDTVRVQLCADGRDVICRARLKPYAGVEVVVAETRPNLLDALLASAQGLVRALARRGRTVRRRRRRS